MAQHQFMSTFRARHTEFFDDMPIILMQRFDVVTLWICSAT
ncbi:Uncharacterised protein [Vibrio cholerae]|nr:Uncharacterised protein [Vibrio cholerae]